MNRILFVILILFMPFGLYAEQLFEVGLRAGLAGYNAQCSYVSPTPNMHAGLQLSYSYHSSRIIGLRVGMTMDRHKAGFQKTDYTDSYTTIDVENDPIQIDYTIGNLSERYTTWSFGIPLQLALAGKGVALYIGPKVVLPFSNSWKETADEAALSVYFPLQDNRVYESYPLAASRSFSENQSGRQKSDKVQWWLASELCYDILVYTSQRYRSYLSVGVYADYSFSREKDTAAERESLLMLSDTREGLPLHRILTSVATGNRQGKRLVKSRGLFDVGLKLSYRFAPYHPMDKNKKVCRCYIF